MLTEVLREREAQLKLKQAKEERTKLINDKYIQVQEKVELISNWRGPTPLWKGIVQHKTKPFPLQRKNNLHLHGWIIALALWLMVLCQCWDSSLIILHLAQLVLAHHIPYSCVCDCKIARLRMCMRVVCFSFSQALEQAAHAEREVALQKTKEGDEVARFQLSQ